MDEFETVIRDVRWVGGDIRVITLDTRGKPFVHRPGQHIQIDPSQFKIVRDIWPGSSQDLVGRFPICSDAIEAGLIEVALRDPRVLARRFQLWKELESHPPIPFLFRESLVPGARLAISGPGGTYCLTDTPSTRIQGLLHLCEGTGIIPNRGMIRHAVFRDWPQHQLLVLESRDAADELFHDEWIQLEAQRYPKLKIVRIHRGFSSKWRNYLCAERLREELRDFIDPRASLAFVSGSNRGRIQFGDENRMYVEPGFCERWAGNPGTRQEGLLHSLGFASYRILNATERQWGRIPKDTHERDIQSP